MNSNRLLVSLATITVLLQISILYRQKPSMLQARRQPPVADAKPNMILDLDGLPIKGSSQAKIVLVEFSDYECPFCARHANDVGKLLDRDFLSSGKVRHAFANNPLPMHPNAKLLATAALCAGYQNKYWEMHDDLFRKLPKNRTDLVAVAQGLNLNLHTFGECLENSHEAARQIEKDQQKVQQLQLTGTPSFAIGFADGEGRIIVRKLIFGAQPLEVFQSAIEALAGPSNG